MRYTVLVEAEEEGGFHISCPALNKGVTRRGRRKKKPLSWAFSNRHMKVLPTQALGRRHEISKFFDQICANCCKQTY